MNVHDAISALNIPVGARVERRVPKKMLWENGAFAAGDRRRISDGIEELTWVAALKPATVGVPEYRDAEREYLEIAVLRLEFRAQAKTPRLVELVHRAVPYPVLLLAAQGETVILSAAEKRWSQGEAGKTVLDGEVAAIGWEAGNDAPVFAEFQRSLALERYPRRDMRKLYGGWLEVITASQAARLTGAFSLPRDPAHSKARSAALRECARLETEMARLCAAAAKTRQMARQVALNAELGRVRTAHALAQAEL